MLPAVAFQPRDDPLHENPIIPKTGKPEVVALNEHAVKEDRVYPFSQYRFTSSKPEREL